PTATKPTSSFFSSTSACRGSSRGTMFMSSAPAATTAPRLTVAMSFTTPAWGARISIDSARTLDFSNSWSLRFYWASVSMRSFSNGERYCDRMPASLRCDCAMDLGDCLSKGRGVHCECGKAVRRDSVLDCTVSQYGVGVLSFVAFCERGGKSRGELDVLWH